MGRREHPLSCPGHAVWAASLAIDINGPTVATDAVLRSAAEPLLHRKVWSLKRPRGMCMLNETHCCNWTMHGICHRHLGLHDCANTT